MSKRNSRWLAIGVPVQGGLLIALVLFTQWWLVGGLDRHQALYRLCEHVQRRVSIIHLWLEEALAEDPTIAFESDVVHPLDDTIYEVSLARERIDASEERAAAMLDELLKRLQAFRYAVDDRWDRHASIGSEPDQQFDAAYSEILVLCSRFGEEVDELASRDRRVLQTINIGIIALVFVLFIVLTVLLLRLRRAVERERLELEARVAARTQELERANDELEIARDAAEAASRAKGEFLANMSHEVRTPLNSILGITSLLQSSSSSPELSKRLDVIEKSSGHLLELLDRILSFSRSDALVPDLTPRPFDPGETVDEIVDLQRDAAERKSIALEWTRPAPVRIESDVSGFRQIAQNLIANAVKFTDEGSVRVTLDLAGDDLCLRVDDTGPGIPTAARDSIFEPFTQVSASTTRAHGGVGLGLAIGKQLSLRMGGELTVRSELGRGSCFELRLPIRFTRDARRHRRLQRRTVRSTGEPARVLVVDDHAMNRKLIAELLGHLGQFCVLASSGYEALDKVGDGSGHDLVLMDCQMPGIDGYECTRRMRTQLAGRALPIVALTARVDSGERERVLAAGMDDYLAKPITVDRLDEILSRWVDATLRRDAVSDGDERAGMDSVPTSSGSEMQSDEGSIAPCNPEAIDDDLGSVQCVDGRVLDGIAKLNPASPDLADEVVRLFLDDSSGRLAELDAAVAAGDDAQVRAQAHRLRSAAVHIGALRLAEVVRWLEHDESVARDALIERVRTTFATTELELRQRLDRGGKETR